MPPKKKKTRAAPKKPFKVLTRKAVIGWLVAIFIACGWMFALGVLVGRDQAPIEFDVDALEKKIHQLRQKESAAGSGGSGKKSSATRDKNELDFYEALPENREDVRIPKKTPPEKTAGTVRPSGKTAGSVSTAAAKPPPEAKDRPRITVAEVPKGAYTIQAASVKSKPDADRLVNKLIRRGYPAYLLTSRIEGKGTWHRVRIGAYPTSDAAKPVLTELRRTGMKPILVKTK
jgi:cell division septation protein DedD